jgi:23S rRNA pseudouridine1911/1915/1917 synthase
MPSVIKTFTLNSSQTGRLDQVVKTLLEVSNARARGIISHGCVTYNQEKCLEIATLVKEHDELRIKYDPVQNYRELKTKTWDDRAFTIVHEDPQLLVVNKVANILTIATDDGAESSLEERVSHYLRHNTRYREALLVQRLDRGVSGLIVIAKTQEAANHLKKQFQEHKPGRIYMAIVQGHLQRDAGTFKSYLKTGDNLDQFSTRDSRDGKLAITHYTVEEYLKDTSLVKVELETGRRNQIRVHFAEKRHPVLGDDRYKKKESRHPLWIANRLALHAQTLEFEHPTTGEQLSFTSELPKVMKRFVTQNR